MPCKVTYRRKSVGNVRSDLGIKGVDSSFRIEPGKARLKTENFWAEFKVKRNHKRGDEYVDVLIGRKGRKEAHTHVGINLDQSLRFLEPRNVLTEVRREIDSKLEGRVADEKIVLSHKPGNARFTFSILIDGPTKTITPLFREASVMESEYR